MLNVLKAILFGIVEGVTEWLPISSTGHMILLEEFIRMDVSEDFWQVFLVVIQLGAILAVVMLFWGQIFPFDFSVRARRNGRVVRWQILELWGKIIVACLPAAVVGIALDETLEALFYNGLCVAIALIVFGVGFIVVETRNRDRRPEITKIRDIDYMTALKIGFFQLIAAIFPGTSRSGATILGGLMIGVSRGVAAKFTFFLAIPVMFGASLLKVVKYAVKNGFSITGTEAMSLIVGMIVAFFVSVFVIRFLLDYIRRHDFKVFGWYRIILGAVVLIAYFTILR